MQAREWVRRHADVLVSGSVALLYTVELLRWAPADKALAVPLARPSTSAGNVRRMSC